MRKRRIDAKIRVAIRAFLAGEAGVTETCQFLSPELSRDKGLVNENDRRLIAEVASGISATLIRAEWHPDFAPAKLKELADYEEKIRDQVKEVCEQILETMKQRKKDAEQE
jgi:hypothetical protein